MEISPRGTDVHFNLIQTVCVCVCVCMRVCMCNLLFNYTYGSTLNGNCHFHAFMRSLYPSPMLELMSVRLSSKDNFHVSFNWRQTISSLVFSFIDQNWIGNHAPIKTLFTRFKCQKHTKEARKERRNLVRKESLPHHPAKKKKKDKRKWKIEENKVDMVIMWVTMKKKIKDKILVTW